MPPGLLQFSLAFGELILIGGRTASETASDFSESSSSYDDHFDVNDQLIPIYAERDVHSEVGIYPEFVQSHHRSPQFREVGMVEHSKGLYSVRIAIALAEERPVILFRPSGQHNYPTLDTADLRIGNGVHCRIDETHILFLPDHFGLLIARPEPFGWYYQLIERESGRYYDFLFSRNLPTFSEYEQSEISCMFALCPPNVAVETQTPFSNGYPNIAAYECCLVSTKHHTASKLLAIGTYERFWIFEHV